MTYFFCSLLLWYLIGLLGSAIGFRVCHMTWREDWGFGLWMAMLGPFNLASVLLL